MTRWRSRGHGLGLGLELYAVFLPLSLMVLAGLVWFSSGIPENVSASASMNFSKALACALVMLSLAIEISLVFGVIRPLKQLNEATRYILAGEFNHRADTTRGACEIRRLAQTFNTIAARLGPLDHAKTEFLATVSHELKNPLAALKEGLNLLSVRGERLTTSARERSFRACLIASKRLEAMIDNLLELSDGRQGLFDGEMSRRDIRGAIQTAMDEIRPLGDRRKISFKLNAPLPVTAPFNWSGVVHVCENLFQNAVKYADEDSIVDIIAGRSGDTAFVRVESQGHPIAAEETKRIFDLFFRGTGAERVSQVQGLGIGLNVVKQIIESHHGTVCATSEARRTCFEFRIPLKLRDNDLQEDPA